MLKDHKAVDIGEIGNYYGGLNLKVEGGVAMCGIKDWDGVLYEDIPEYLYKVLMKFQKEQETKATNK